MDLNQGFIKFSNQLHSYHASSEVTKCELGLVFKNHSWQNQQKESAILQNKNKQTKQQQIAYETFVKHKQK